MADVQAGEPAEQPGRFYAARVISVSVGHALHDTYTAFLAPLLPLFIKNLGLSIAQAGLLSMFLQWPSLLQPVIGHVADRVNLRYVVILAPLVTAAMMSLLGVAPNYALLALLLVAAGVSSASMHAVGPVIAGTLSGRNLGRGMGVWMLGGELGRTLGPVIIVSVVRLLGLPGTPWLILAGLLISALLYIPLRDVPNQPVHAGRRMPWRPALRNMLPLLLPLAGIILVRSFMSASLTTYLPVFLTEAGTDFWLAGASLTILEAAGVVGALLGGSLSDWLGRRGVLFVSMLATPLLMFVFLAARGWAQLPLLLAMGFTSLSVTPVLMALVQESFPEHRALANGIYMSMSFLIRAAVTVALGAFADQMGSRWAFTASAIIPLLGLPLLYLLPKNRPVRGKEEREAKGY